MNFKKTVAKTLIFAMALSFAPVYATTTKAAVPKQTFSAADEEITTEGKFWGIAKLTKGKKGSNLEVAGSHYKVGSVEKVVGKTLDLSAFKFGKDVYLAFGNTAEVKDGEWTVQKIAAEEKTLKMHFGSAKKIGKFDGKVNTLGGDFGYIGASTGKELKEIDLGGLEVHNGNGTWASFENFFGGKNDDKVSKKLQALTQTGANLYFRIKGTDGTFTVNSKEAKLKIPARKSAPKLVVKGEKTGLKKGMEYILVDKGNDMGNAWVKVEKPKEKEYLFQVFDGAKDQDLYVRLAAKGKNSASKVRKLSVVHQKVPEIPAGDANADNIVKATGVENFVKSDQENEKVGLATKVTYDITKGAEITNTSKNNYEFYVSYDGSAPANNVKWTSLKAAADVTNPTKVALKYAKAKAANAYGNADSKLYLRLAGKKQENNVVTLPSKSLAVKLNFAKVEQKLSLTDKGTNVKIEDAKATLYSVPVAQDASYTFKVQVTNLQKKGVKPKMKVDKKDGIKVTIGEFDDSGKAEVNVEITTKAFPKTVDGKITVKLSYEGLTDSPFEIAFSSGAMD